MRFLLLLTLAAYLGALEDPTIKVQQLRKEAREKEAAYMRDWFARANLDPVPTPKAQNPNDPRASETAAIAKAKEINDFLAEAKRQRASQPLVTLAPSVGSAIPECRTILPDDVAKILAAETLRKGAPESLAGNR